MSTPVESINKRHLRATLMIEEKDQLEQVHPAAAEISAENAAETDPVPLHPGSERALEELNQ